MMSNTSEYSHRNATVVTEKAVEVEPSIRDQLLHTDNQYLGGELRIAIAMRRASPRIKKIPFLKGARWKSQEYIE